MVCLRTKKKKCLATNEFRRKTKEQRTKNKDKMEVNFSHSKSKVSAICDAISNAVVMGELSVGDNLPSINEASATFKVSRDTVFKAYSELKKRGLIESNPMKGYFVKGDINHVLLLLDTYSPFKQNLYNQFVENLPKSWKVDLIFHQYNKHLFETIIRESIGRYNMYVVMNFSNTQLSESLKAIPEGKLLLLDFGNFDKQSYSYICQDFDKALYDCLYSFEDLFLKYNKMVMVFPEENCHPESSVNFVREFCKEVNIDFELVRNFSQWKEIENKSIYFIISHTDLVKVIQESKSKNYIIGKDIGVLVYNDEPLLEVIQNGIASVSIDFGLLGKKAAHYVSTKKPIQEYLPTKLSVRASI